MLDTELAQHQAALRSALYEHTEEDTMERARFRTAAIFGAFYDDEPGEPDQAIRDLLTDIMHEAESRGVDMTDALDRAAWMHDQERQGWGRE